MLSNCLQNANFLSKKFKYHILCNQCLKPEVKHLQNLFHDGIRYPIIVGLFFQLAGAPGFEPRLAVLETAVLPLTPRPHAAALCAAETQNPKHEIRNYRKFTSSPPCAVYVFYTTCRTFLIPVSFLLSPLPFLICAKNN